MIELQVGGACYSWRLSPPRRLGGEFSARKKIVWCSREGFVRGTMLTPREPRRATLVEHAIELLSLGLWPRFLQCSTCGRGLYNTS